MKIIIYIVLFFGFFSGTYNRVLPVDLPASSNKIEVEVIDTLTKSNAAEMSVDHTLFYEGDTIILPILKYLSQK